MKRSNRYDVVYTRFDYARGYWHPQYSKRFRSLACAVRYADMLSSRHCRYVGHERHKSYVSVLDAKTYNTMVYEAPYERALSGWEVGYW